jgi:hypothetical protein
VLGCHRSRDRLAPVEGPCERPEPDDDGVGMSHEDLVAALRRVDGLVDVSTSPPVFHFRSRPFLHFHHGPEGTYADVRFDRGGFEPVWASTPQQRLELLGRVCDHVDRVARTRKQGRRRP